jgi:hypothetical protein
LEEKLKESYILLQETTDKYEKEIHHLKDKLELYRVINKDCISSAK